ncbi:MAG: NusG domain II-containing protein [Mogibacterium sp.]|nr:NusG domain II-containing protein [Mogibacterium sp.]
MLIVLLALGLAATVVLARTGAGAPADDMVVIKSGGEIFGRYPLNEDVEIEVPAPSGGENAVTIKGGSVTVSSASCKNQVCVKHGSISKSGESIVCLPNRLIVTIEDKSGGEYDSITS